jgi:hypothetical protein
VSDPSVRTADVGDTRFVKGMTGNVSCSAIDFAIMSACLLHVPWTASTAHTTLATHRPLVLEFKGSLSDKKLVTMPQTA